MSSQKSVMSCAVSPVISQSIMIWYNVLSKSNFPPNNSQKTSNSTPVGWDMGDFCKFIVWTNSRFLPVMLQGSKFASSQWETALLCNDVSHWLGGNLESALCCIQYHVFNHTILSLKHWANHDNELERRTQEKEESLKLPSHVHAIGIWGLVQYKDVILPV